jgi:choice-of-anchor B domain-containing protein
MLRKTFIILLSCFCFTIFSSGPLWARLIQFGSDTGKTAKAMNPAFPDLNSNSPFQFPGPLHPVPGPNLQSEWVGTPRWMSGISWGGETFFNSIGKGVEFFVTYKSTVRDTDYVPVEIRFSSNPAEQSLCQTFRIADYGVSGYDATGAGTFPGSAWDISNPSSPRRLNLCFTEWDDGADPLPPPDFIWDPDGSTGPFYGKREYLLVMASDYDSGAMYAGKNVSDDSLDVMYIWWPKVESGHTLLESEPAWLKILIDYFQNFQATIGDQQVTLNWDYAGPGVSQFKIYFGISSPPDSLLDSLAANTFAYLHTGLTNSVTYYYQLEALDSNRLSLGKSNILTVTAFRVSENMTLLARWSEGSFFTDIVGYVDGNGREYAVIGNGEGVSLVDIDTSPPQQVSYFVGGTNYTTDVAVYQNYVISINANGPTLIVDVSDVYNPVIVATLPPDGVGTHTCYVEGDYLYVMGTNGGPGVLEIFDISDPSAPVKTARVPANDYHDMDIRGDTLYACRIFGGGIDILDISDKYNPTFISNFNYAGSGAHNIEISEDGKYAFVGDEIGSAGNWTRVFDISNPFNVAKVADLIVNPSTIVHNCYVKNGLLYIAHYTEGVRVWDVTNPLAPVEIAYFDTYPASGYGYEGCWTAWPYLPSGRIIASDISNGLFVLAVDSSVIPCAAIPGDADADFQLDLTDIVATVNYIFNKSGCAPLPLCWLSGLLCRGDWNGTGTITLGDVVRAINYVFSKPGGPWTPLTSGDCCQPVL